MKGLSQPDKRRHPLSSSSSVDILNSLEIYPEPAQHPQPILLDVHPQLAIGNNAMDYAHLVTQPHVKSLANAFHATPTSFMQASARVAHQPGVGQSSQLKNPYYNIPRSVGGMQPMPNQQYGASFGYYQDYAPPAYFNYIPPQPALHLNLLGPISNPAVGQQQSTSQIQHSQSSLPPKQSIPLQINTHQRSDSYLPYDPTKYVRTPIPNNASTTPAQQYPVPVKMDQKFIGLSAMSPFFFPQPQVFVPNYSHVFQKPMQAFIAPPGQKKLVAVKSELKVSPKAPKAAKPVKMGVPKIKDTKEKNAKATKPRKSKSKSELMCVCKQEYNPDRFCIQCDCCDKWYHGSCVNVREENSSGLTKWFCIQCEDNFHLKSVWKRRCSGCNKFIAHAAIEAEPAFNVGLCQIDASNIELEKRKKGYLAPSVTAEHAMSQFISSSIIIELVDKAFTVVDLKHTSRIYHAQVTRTICSDMCGERISAKLMPSLLNEPFIFEKESDDVDGMVVDAVVIEPQYPIPESILLETLDNQDLSSLAALYTRRKDLTTRHALALKNGAKIESFIYRTQDLNSRIKKFHSIIDHTTNEPLQYTICGYSAAIQHLDTYEIIVSSDARYYTSEGVCLNQRRCIKHDKWETMMMAEAEAEVIGVAITQDRCKCDITYLVEQIKERRTLIFTCQKNAREDQEVPASFERYLEVSI